MEPSSSSELAALVAAWHNRHPLARRITAAQVQGAGLVALPFVAKRGSEVPEELVDEDSAADAAPPATGWRGRLLARLAPLWQGLRRRPARPAPTARPRSLRPAFVENFIAPIRPSAVARFARRHGTFTRPDCPPDWPQRDVARGPAPAGTVPQTLYLRTAAIEVGRLRRRVLIGAGRRPVVTGPRLWSRPRLSAIGGLAACAVAVAAWFGTGAHEAGPAEVATRLAALTGGRPAAAGTVQDAAASAPAASAAASSVPTGAHPAAPASAVAGAPTPASAASSTPAAGTLVAQPAASPTPVAAAAAGSSAAPANASAAGPASAATTAAASASSPAVADGATGEPADPRRGIRPTLSPEARLAARQESEALRAAHPASAAAAASASDGKVYAVATPATRTRAGAQLRIVLMNAPTEADPGRPRAEVLQVGDGWRAVIWPYDNRDAAERAREQLVSRGIPAEVVGF